MVDSYKRSLIIILLCLGAEQVLGNPLSNKQLLRLNDVIDHRNDNQNSKTKKLKEILKQAENNRLFKIAQSSINSDNIYIRGKKEAIQDFINNAYQEAPNYQNLLDCLKTSVNQEAFKTNEKAINSCLYLSQKKEVVTRFINNADQEASNYQYLLDCLKASVNKELHQTAMQYIHGGAHSAINEFVRDAYREASNYQDLLNRLRQSADEDNAQRK